MNAIVTQATPLSTPVNVISHREDVIFSLGVEKTNARKNKKGAPVVAAFDVLEDLAILRADGGGADEIAERLDRYIADFKA